MEGPTGLPRFHTEFEAETEKIGLRTVEYCPLFTRKRDTGLQAGSRM